MKKKQENIDMLVQRFQRRNRTQKNPVDLARRAAKHGLFDVCSSAVRLIVTVGVLAFAGYTLVFESDKEVPWVRLVLYLAAGWTLRAAMMSFAKPLLPELPELLIVHRWYAFMRHLKEMAMWDQLAGVATQEELDTKVREYFSDLVNDISEAINNQNIWQYVAFQHLYLHARGVAEGLLGIPVPQLPYFEVGFTPFEPGQPGKAGVPDAA